MIKRLSYLFLIGAFLLSFPNNSNAAFIKSDHKALKFCEKYTMVGSFINAYPRITPAIIALPFIPFVAVSVVPGLADKPTIIQYICDTITTVANLENKDAIFFMANQLNDMTGNKWDKDLEMFSASFSLAQSLWDFENGKSRKGALQSVSTHKEINDFMETSYSWYNKRFNDKDATLKNRGQREGDMDALANASYKVAMLKEITNCPTPPDSNLDYQKIYKDKISKHEKIKEETQLDIDYYQEKLLQMAPKFLSNENEMSTYISDLRNLIVNAVSYKTSYRTKTETTIKKDPKKKDADGNPKKNKVNISKKTNVYQAISFNEKFNDFTIKHESEWASWVQAQVFARGSKGLFDNPSGKIEEDFKDLSHECRSSKVMKGIDVNRPDYDTVLITMKERCKENIRFDEKKVQNLFAYYVNQLKVSLLANKSANAEIWTHESWYLGVNRTVSGTTADNIPQENVVCESADKLEYNDQLLLKTKKDTANNDLKEIIAKQYLKQNEISERQAEASKSHADDMSRKKDFADRQNKTMDKMVKKPLVPVPLKSRKEYDEE